jgi:hypothetical protein
VVLAIQAFMKTQAYSSKGLGLPWYPRSNPLMMLLDWQSSTNSWPMTARIPNHDLQVDSFNAVQELERLRGPQDITLACMVPL